MTGWTICFGCVAWDTSIEIEGEEVRPSSSLFGEKPGRTDRRFPGGGAPRR
jgi:hypothetical protein